MKYLIILLASAFLMGCDYIVEEYSKKVSQPSMEQVDAPDSKENKEPTLEDLQLESTNLKQKLKDKHQKISEKNGVKTVMEIQEPLQVKKASTRYIYLGSFKTEYFYEEMLKKAKEHDLEVIVGSVQKGGDTLRTIKVGPMDKDSAKSKLKELKEEGFPQDIFLTK